MDVRRVVLPEDAQIAYVPDRGLIVLDKFLTWADARRVILNLLPDTDHDTLDEWLLPAFPIDQPRRVWEVRLRTPVVVCVAAATLAIAALAGVTAELTMPPTSLNIPTTAVHTHHAVPTYW